MLKINPLILAAVAMTSVALLSSDCAAQACSSCGPSTGQFGYPLMGGVNCGGCGSTACGGRCGAGGGGHFQELRAKWDQQQMINSRIAARNDAWPKPFDCADRQLYFSIFAPMIDQGFEEQCVLSSMHFDEDTNQLNRVGKHAVAGIMQNMPSSRKRVFVHREANDVVNSARLQAVKETIDTFYSASGPAQVAFSSKLPITTRGTSAEAIAIKWREKMPSPVIPISAGESVNAAVGGN